MSRTGILTSTICLLAFLCLSCGDDDSFTTNPNSFRGNWNVTFSGDSVGQGVVTIDPNGVFFNSITLQNGGGMLNLSGTVSSDGAIDAKILSGTTENGTMKGTLSGEAGSGTWQTTDGKTGNFQFGRL